MDLGNEYCEWSAIVTVQNITPHYSQDKDMKSHLSMGQPLAYAYLGRPKKAPQQNLRNQLAGSVTEALKLTIRSKKARTREGRTSTPQQLVDIVRDQGRIQHEMSLLLEGNTPQHQELGLTADRWARILSGLKYHRNLRIPGLQQLQGTLQAVIDHIHNLEKQDKKSAVEDWIERILDASQGYRMAHNFTRGTPKAPPLPTGMWHKGEYLGIRT